MSANNQTLIVEYKHTYYIFNNVLAESWDEVNTVDIKDSKFSSPIKHLAYTAAKLLEDLEPTEYGIGEGILLKDRAKVTVDNSKESKELGV